MQRQINVPICPRKSSAASLKFRRVLIFPSWLYRMVFGMVLGHCMNFEIDCTLMILLATFLIRLKNLEYCLQHKSN